MAGGRHEKLKATRDDLVVRLKIDDTGWTLKEASPVLGKLQPLTTPPIIRGRIDRCFCQHRIMVSASLTQACHILVGTA